MTRKRLSKSDIRELNEKLREFAIELDKKDAVELVDGKTYEVNGTAWLFEREGKLIPHLKFLQERPTVLKIVVVDMGAVPFMAKGADVMRPGITEIDEHIGKGDLVVIVDETHGKPLAVGQAMLATEEMRAATSGKVIKTLHYVGDKEWG